jgi:FkbM family methyltransferase
MTRMLLVRILQLGARKSMDASRKTLVICSNCFSTLCWATVKFVKRLSDFIPENLRARLGNTIVASWLRLLIMRLLKDNQSELFFIKQGPLKGLQIYTSLDRIDHYVEGTYEPEVIAEFYKHLSNGMCALDIGAHHGYASMLLSKLVGENGKVIAYEPVPENVEQFRKTIETNKLMNVILVPYAVSDETKEVIINMSRLYSSAMHFVDDNDTQSEHFHVKAVAIDDHIGGELVSRVDFVKIDVEGHEIEVLKGMLNTIEEFRPVIVCEVHNPDNMSRIVPFLEKYGYEVRTIRNIMPIQIVASIAKHG